MLTFIKLGGSLITNKQVKNSFRGDILAHLANELREVLVAKPETQLIIGHGSGSFGHFEAKRYDTISGVQTKEQWLGFARVATIAAELNYLVAQSFQKAEIPIFRVQPSASAIAHDGVIVDMALLPIERALRHRIIPLVFGDVAFDDLRGGTIISTETIFAYLAKHLSVQRIILLGEVDGVYDLDGKIISRITPASFEDIRASIQGSSGVDVTGGMLTKVQDMLNLLANHPELTVQILNGNKPDVLKDAILFGKHDGTLIEMD